MQTTHSLAALPGQDIPVLSRPGRLSSNQIGGLAALGVALWLLMALLIRYGAPIGLFEGAASALLFISTLPAVLLLIWATRRVMSLRSDLIVAAVAVACSAALLCDGIALKWASSVYGTARGSLLPAVAWLLWSYGVSLTWALLMSRRT